MGVLSAIERGESLRRKRRRKKRDDSSSSSSSDEDGKKGLLKKKRDRRLTRKFVLMKEREERPCCGVSASHMVLYVGFTFSVLLWGACFWLGIVGGLTGATKVSLSQPNCTATLGGATLLLYTDLGLMLLAVVVFVASVINPLVSDVANAMDRESLISCNTNPQLVFGLSFIVWLVWMGVSSYIYYLAAQSNLLAAGEFSWSWSSVFSALMVLVPITSIVKTLWSQR